MQEGVVYSLSCKKIPKGERQGSRKFLSSFVISSFSILILILTTGCTSGNDGKEKNYLGISQKELPLVTFSDNLWGTIQLDSVASNNVVKLIEELNPSTIEYDNIIQDGAISGEIMDAKGKKQIRVLYDLTLIDNKVFEGPESKAIFRIAEQNIYSAIQLSKVVENCNNVRIEANDLNNQLILKNNDELVKILKESSQIKDDSEKMVISLGKNYPDYKITLGLGSQDIVIHLQNEKYFYIEGQKSIRVYNSTNSFWNYCIKVLPYDKPVPGSLEFLFIANSLECKEIGNLKHRKLGVARLLQKGAFQENKKVIDPRYHLIFTFNQEQIEITLGNNSFEYNGKTFKLDNVDKEFFNLVSAG